MTAWIVGGIHRSGTTMMMQALEAGGLIVARDDNPGPRHDHYELPPSAYRAGFPRQYEGHAIKVLGDDLLKLAPRIEQAVDGVIPSPHPDPYMVFFMIRNPDVCCQSWLQHSNGRTQHPAALTGNAKLYQTDILNAAQMRHDMRVFIMHYDDVVVRPEDAMQAIVEAEMVTLDFDPEAAAAVVRTPEAAGAA